MEEQIRSKMKELADRWVGKPEPKRESNDYFLRGFDRLIYQELQKKLKKLTNGKTNHPTPTISENENNSESDNEVGLNLLTPEEARINDSVPPEVSIFSVNQGKVTIQA